MKMYLPKIAFAAAVLLILNGMSGGSLFAQSPSAITDLLVQKSVLTRREADSLRVMAEFNDKLQPSDKVFKIGLEFRPRAEFRNGYRQLRNDTTEPAYFVSQRSRVNFTYTQSRVTFHTSFQDVRVWGQYGQTSVSGSFNVFEAYVEPGLTENWSLRVGRQKIELDNGRLFSAGNWSQTAKAHDGLDLIYNGDHIHSELILCFNQSSERVYETDYSPSSFNNYKLLNVYFLKIKLNEYFSLTALNAADGNQSKTSVRTLYERGTSGGRLDIKKGVFYLTLCGYYQYGRLQNGKQISASYFQPELQVNIQKLTTRLGAEFMSGDDATSASSISKSFVPLYGVAWKFMGNMDYFTNFPGDMKNGGIINPYLFLMYEINPGISVRSDLHLFYLQNKVLDPELNVLNAYLGFENDLSVRIKCNDFTTLDAGFSYMASAKSMEYIKGGNNNLTPVWSYLMVTFKPGLLNRVK